jgi:hypothetical protein
MHKSIEMLQPGLTMSEIATFTVAEFDAAGLDLNASSRVGHGVGLVITEPPSISLSDSTIVESGKVLAIEFFAAGYDHDVDAAGRDGDLSWVHWHWFEGPDGDEYRLVWAEADGCWYFSAVAESPEYLDALAEALGEAAGTASGQ